MRRPVMLGLMAVGGLLAPPVAGAAPTVLGRGDAPWLHVDREDTAHVAWIVSRSVTEDELHYRRRPAGASAWGPDTVIPAGLGADVTGPQIVQEPPPSGRLLIVGTAPGPSGPVTHVVASSDGGASWSAPAVVYEGTPAVNPTIGRVPTAAAGPAGLLLVNGNPTIRLVTVPSALAPTVPREAEVPISPLPYNGSVTFDPQGSPVFAFGDLGRTYVRPGPAGSDILAGDHPEIGNSGIKIAGGPRGVAVVVLGGVPRVGPNHLFSRTLSGSALTPPVRLTAPSDRSPGEPFLAADASGRFHLVWRSEGTRLLYRRSEDGARWRPAVELARASSMFNPVVSAGPDGRGWAVWQQTLASGTSPLLAVPLDDPGVADTSGIPNPVVTRRGASVFVTPRRPSLATVRRRKCVQVRVQTTRPARIRVAIFSGRRSIRIFGARVVRFRQPGKRLVCIKVPLRARTFDVRQPFRFAFAVKPGATPRRGERAAALTLTRFTRFR